ncbi:M15 family metallopeptidase [Salibacterium qingdaonense]|uniref:D-alanyl-D-alanine carboxypeptidase n=1 Tax=Salibacterium qingdaonense TaxID=266892 RepID=A0A1I4KN70_9BACI|nr:M15 family metallopeptidase [Salibacterium qingdaonense]SFL80214.1 D-alanyl-D-alanine carboxypeptidase [Salibacterium qingdaonense]
MNKTIISFGAAVLLALGGCSASGQSEGEEQNNSGDASQQEEQAEQENEAEKESEPVFEGEEEQAETTEPKAGEQEQTTTLPSVNEDGVLQNPEALNALVNREYHLPSDYVPEDLTVPDVRFPYEEDVPKKQVREPAAKALESLFSGAEEEGLYLFAVSGYRSYDRQESIFAANAEEDGVEAANQYSAQAGESEHQSGLAMDVSSQSADFTLTNAFGETPEGMWLKENAHEYGFVIRYPEDKTDITGYQYEPWHLRYVGKELAAALHDTNQTLEEYYGTAE